MTSFLFWNIMRKDLRALVAAAVVERDVDILMLAESGTSDAEVSAALKTSTGRDYAALSQESDKVRLFTRLTNAKWIRRQQDPTNARSTVWSAEIGRPPGIILATAHLVSKSHETIFGQAHLAAEISTEIFRLEDYLGHQRTLFVGDLNMNPFDDGVISSHALHAVMTRQLAQREDRIVQGKSRRFFYNPMWGFFGDRTGGPAGTYYHRSATDAELFWHMLDQVLLRPALMDSLHDLAILDCIGGQSLLTAPTGRPDTMIASDHLPLAFRLNLE